jgi:hypothetical protein
VPACVGKSFCKAWTPESDGVGSATASALAARFSW